MREVWERAVVEHPADEFWIATFLSQDQTLLARWVQAYIARAGGEDWKWERIDDKVTASVGELQLDVRLGLLRCVAEHGRGGMDHQLVAHLVGQDDETGRLLFSESGLEDYRDGWLRGEPTEAWLRRALIAYEAGMDPRQIVYASMWGGMAFWSGNLSDVHDRRIKAFQRLRENTANRKALKIIDAGEKLFTAQRDRELEAERRDATFGR